MQGKLWIALVVLAVPLAGCADGDSAGESLEVRALDNEFDPAQLNVTEGAEVTWTNEGELTHSVEVRPEGETETVHSSDIAPGASTSFTFDDPRTYEVWCKYHGEPDKGMAGTVTVHAGGYAQD